jgi:hypothetical protein
MTIQGAAELHELLKNTERRVRTKAAKRAVKAGGRVVKSHAEDLALFNVGGEMGALLAENLQLAPYKKPPRGSTGLYLRLKPGVIPFVHVTQDGTRQYVPHAIEYGHVSPSGAFVAAIPFMRPAVDQRRKHAEWRMEQELLAALKLNG